MGGGSLSGAPATAALMPSQPALVAVLPPPATATSTLTPPSDSGFRPLQLLVSYRLLVVLLSAVILPAPHYALPPQLAAAPLPPLRSAPPPAPASAAPAHGCTAPASPVPVSSRPLQAAPPPPPRPRALAFLTAPALSQPGAAARMPPVQPSSGSVHVPRPRVLLPALSAKTAGAPAGPTAASGAHGARKPSRASTIGRCVLDTSSAVNAGQRTRPAPPPPLNDMPVHKSPAFTFSEEDKR